MKYKKKAFDMPFSWIFAIIAGAIILFLAIYTASKFVDVGKHRQYTEAAKSLSILVDPLETGVGSSTGYPIHFRRETRTYYNCYLPSAVDKFGKQTLQFSEQSGLKKEWAEPGGEITIKNKFIFAESMEQGEDLNLFSKSFYLGFNIGDIIIASSQNYCFVNAPATIKEDIEFLSTNLKNLNFSNTLSGCSKNSKKVCFGAYTKGCNVTVSTSDDYLTGYVEKEDKKMAYINELLYGAIFSSPEIYNCNILRIGKKISSLAEVYLGKIEIVNMEDCNSIIGVYLEQIRDKGKNMKSSQDLITLYGIAQEMDLKNRDANCRIYGGKDY